MSEKSESQSETSQPETGMIEVTVGPDRGCRWTVPGHVAKQAIADGWARDAMQPPAEDAAVLTSEEREKAIAAAMKAARELRGEPEPEEEAGGNQKAAGEYETSDMQPRRGPGRPRKTESEQQSESEQQ